MRHKKRGWQIKRISRQMRVIVHDGGGRRGMGIFSCSFSKIQVQVPPLDTYLLACLIGGEIGDSLFNPGQYILMLHRRVHHLQAWTT